MASAHPCFPYAISTGHISSVKLGLLSPLLRLLLLQEDENSLCIPLPLCSFFLFLINQTLGNLHCWRIIVFLQVSVYICYDQFVMIVTFPFQGAPLLLFHCLLLCQHYTTFLSLCGTLFSFFVTDLLPREIFRKSLELLKEI